MYVSTYHVCYVYMYVFVCVFVCEYTFYRLENVSSEATPLAVLNDTAVWEIDQISPQGKSVSHSTKRKVNFVYQKL